MSSLSATRYRRDFRNLIPFADVKLTGDKTVLLSLTADHLVWSFIITSDCILTINNGSKMDIYHTDQEQATKLIACMKEN